MHPETGADALSKPAAEARRRTVAFEAKSCYNREKYRTLLPARAARGRQSKQKDRKNQKREGIMMKKLTALFLALVLLCSLAACGKQSAVRRPDDDSSSSAAQAEPPRAPGVSEPEEEEPEEPEEPRQMEDYLGSWNGNVYSNKALGLSFVMPEGWTCSTDEELLEMIDAAVNSDFLSDRTKLAAGLSKSRMFYGLFAEDPVSGTSVQLMFLNMEGTSGSISEEECARQMAAQQEGLLDEASGVTLNFIDTYRAPLGGVDFLVLPAEINMSGTEVMQWYYIRIVDNYGAVIAITALAGQDIDTMEGGASAFAPLGSASGGSTGTSGAPTATGDIGRTFSTMFFDYTVLSAESPSQYHGYTPEDGNKLVVVRVRVKNDFGSTLPMFDTDFPLFWGDGGYDYSWAVDAFTDDMMPLEWELEDGKEATWEMLFEVPANKMDFSLSYLEEYTDRDGNDQTGDWYDAQFTLVASSAA